MLVRFDCGCVGILDGDRFPVVVESCDGDGGFGFFRRDMTGKTFERLAVGEEETLIKGIVAVRQSLDDLRQGRVSRPR